MDAIERVLQAHLRPGDRVAVENPGYAALYDLLRARGLALEPVALDDRGMLAADLRAALARGAVAVVITPRGQNPTGAALDADRARELRAVLDEYPGALGRGRPPRARRRQRAAHAPVRGRPSAGPPRARSPRRSDQTCALPCSPATPRRSPASRGASNAGPAGSATSCRRSCSACGAIPPCASSSPSPSTIYAARREQLLACLAREGVRAHGASGLNVWLPVHEEAAVIGALMQRGWVLAPGAPYRLPRALSPPSALPRRPSPSTRPRGCARIIAEVLAPARPSRSG